MRFYSPSLLAFFLAAVAISSSHATDETASANETEQSEHELMLSRVINAPSDPRPNAEGIIAAPPSDDPDNYCPWSGNVENCQEGYELGLKTSAPAGVYDGLIGIDGRQNPKELPQEFDEPSRQEGYENGMVVGYYRGAAWGLGQNLGLWEGINDCLTGKDAKEPKDMVYEGWLIELATTGTDDQKKFAVQVMEGWNNNYDTGYALCENKNTEAMKAYATNRGMWNGRNDYLEGLEDQWYGKPSRIDKEMAALYLTGYELGRKEAAESSENGEPLDHGPYRYDHVIPYGG